MKKNTLILLLSCLFINLITAQNLLVNGNFESGGVGVGFNINSTGYNYIATPTSSTSPGDYSFGSNPQPYNTSNFISGFDHTTGLATGKMMIIDGSTDGGNPSFWKAGNSGGGVCGLTVGATYTFRYWVKTISTNVTGASTQPDIRVVFNNATVLTSPTSFLAPLPATGWEMRTYTFTPTNACVNIELRNFNVNTVGNDFAIDDLSLTPPSSPLLITYSALNTSCPSSSDGSVAIYAAGGSQPYTSYSISGPVSQINALGIFTGLPAGTYTISVTDSASITVSQSNVVIANPVNPLVVSSNTSICNGSNTTLSVSGGSTYTWTASPADPSLTTPNSATPAVSPSATTTYTVTSSITSPRSLIVNGDFSQGNSGFGTDYQYLASAPVTGVQKAYGIVARPNLWFAPFSNCPDHTTGTGNMMVVDGSNLNAGNDRLWSQTVPVLPGQNHTFSYWIQTVATPNPAQIEVLINGVSQGIGLAPAIATCGNWTQYSYVWNSGASNTAQIVMYDRTTSVAGNDFAIDDISFTTNATCSVTQSVTVTVNSVPTVVVNSPEVCFGSSANIIATPSPAGPTYTYAWTVPSGATNPGNVSSFNTTVSGVYSVVITNNITNCSSQSSSGTATIHSLPTVTVSNITTCVSQVTAIPGLPGIYSYVWTVPLGVTNPGNVPSFTTTTSGTYTVVITNTITNCVSSQIATNVNIIPIALNLPNNLIVCNGTLIPSLNFTTNYPPNLPTFEGANISWTNNNPLLAIGSAGQGNLTNVLATNTTSAPIVATITVTASLSGCTDVTNSFTITINPSPSVLVNSPVKCTGDTAPVLIQATPSVAGTYNYAWTVPAGVPAPGNVPSFNSAIAGNYTVVITNTTTGCVSQPSTGTLTYITNCCPDEITIDAPNPVLCNASSCTTITASYIDIKDTTSYTVASIPYAPLVPLGNAGTSLCNVDDAYSAVTPIPFDFSFYGSCFDSFQLSTNTYLTFTTNNANCTGGSPWAFTQAIPALFGANVEYQNSIYFPMNDTNPAVATPAATPIDVRYIVDGVAPCRKLIVNIKNMPLFSCGTAQGLQESQLVLYESTNIIDVYVKSRTVCAGWNSGSGVIGLTGQTAAEGIAAPGRNTGTWTATNEAWRFSPSGPSLTAFRWLQNGNPIGTTPTISVCPTVTTTYTAEVRYTQCNVPGPPSTIVRTVTEPVTIEVFPDDTLTPNSITNCIPNNVFNLTSNEPTVLGGLIGTGAYDVYYYTNQADAENAAANSIANPAAYILASGTSQTIYMSLISTTNPCIRVKSFNIILDDCSTCPTITNPSATQTLCLNSDPTPFTVNTTFTAANSISYVYFTTPQVGTNMYTGGTLLANVTPNAGGIATYDAPVLGSAGSLPNALGTYYVYAIANPAPSDVTCRPFQLIQVIVNTSPNAGTDGNTTICETSIATINLSSLITGEQAGGTWSQTGGTGGVFNAASGTYTPAIGATTSTFNYTLTGVAPCTGDFSIATVNINPQPNAGTDGALNVCLGDTTSIDLYSIITSEQTGGTWVRTSGTGGTFNALAGTFIPSATTTNSTFTYTLLGTAPCIDDSSIATINFITQPTAGIDGSLNICGSSSTPINLFSLITGESSGGVWTQTSGTGGTFNAGSATFTPSAGTTSSTFTYTVTGAAPCGPDSSIASVNITAQLDAGIDGSLTVCETSGIIDLYSVITSEQSGGSWTRTGGTGGTFDSVNGTFTPSVGSTTSTFLYTLSGTAPCISDSSVATITINAQPVAGVDGGITICETSTTAITLSTLITGEQIGGTWTRTGGTGGSFNAAAGIFTPALGATTSTFTYTLTGTAPCINDTSVATVTINAQPVAGLDGATTVCETLATAINLATLITAEQSG
ncbi:beta strand repeat-containing protein, partial [Flavobacterium chungnamense]|uniref:beta strand repeat-containing protein n=1 Tax=Flavobacterium chungnamense TaxID=706182 RepID=UPI003CD0A1D1